MIVSKYVYPDLDGVLSAERELRAALGQIAASTQECIFINVLHEPEQALVVRSESEATRQLVNDALACVEAESA
ncbi:hypothetical protein [Hyphobacterium marinum]|uniref:Uncharacterized protein n=1 Tax=Hyphobacterium marinum TaxID=3116574 RepID=A0ABU7LY11_9PROT|nr:hypothetical protein [Hyphobacterium sp. Y6023]MEE2566436.1 hypothetical protein [Hyphobacterium sp. Y6023]